MTISVFLIFLVSMGHQGRAHAACRKDHLKERLLVDRNGTRALFCIKAPRQ